MAKLQRIVRSNGSEVYSLNLPQDVIEATGWQKGDDIEPELKGDVVELKKSKD